MSFSPGLDNYTAARDQNRIPIATGLSNTDATQTLPFKIDSVTGRLLVDATGGSSTTVYSQTPVGAIDGVNKVYTVTNAITTVITFTINGQFIHPAEYSVVTTTITLVTALPASLSGTGFTVVYV